MFSNAEVSILFRYFYYTLFFSVSPSCSVHVFSYVYFCFVVVSVEALPFNYASENVNFREV